MYFFLIPLVNGILAIKQPLRIYGGIDAKSDEFPYVVRIEGQVLVNIKNTTVIAKHLHLCTASALSPVWLLSAAHCLTVITEGAPISDKLKEVGDPTVKIVIRYGHVENSPWVKDSFSDVLFTVFHPLYLQIKRPTLGFIAENDIGLLKVSPITARSYIKLSAVDYRTMYGHQVALTGFGITTKTNNEGRVETNSTLFLMKPLQVLKVVVTKCSHSKLVPALCLAHKCNDENTACPGDSGGPVIHQSGVIGVLSMGTPSRYCRLPTTQKRVDFAGFITPVSPYIEWISSYVTGAKHFNAFRYV